MVVKMVDAAPKVPDAPVFKRPQLKTDAYKSIDDKIIVEDKLLNLMAIKFRTMCQDEIVLLASLTD